MGRKHDEQSHFSALWVLSDLRLSGDWKEPYPLEPWSLRQDSMQLVGCNQGPGGEEEDTVIGGSGLLGGL